MKPIMRRLLLLLALGLPAVAGADGLIANPSFEVLVDGWPTGWTATARGQVELMTDGGHEGRQYLRLKDPDTKTGLTVESARLPCRPGGQYTATVWFRTGDKCSPGIYLNFYDEQGTRIHSAFGRAVGPTQGWVQARTQTRAPAEVSQVSVSLYAYIGDIGMFDADDVNMVVEGGGEPGTGGIPAAVCGDRPAVDMGDRRELFVDSFLVDGLSGTARRRLHRPEWRQVVLQTDAPWEGPTSAYFSVVPVDGKVRLYYRGSGQENSHELCCVAESDDGIHFTRPKLGLFEWQGNKDNSIVWMGPGQHNFTPFLDANPAAPPDQRFKALASAGPKASLVAFVSADGYRWTKLREEPVITVGAFDSQNLAFWDPVRQVYVEYHRGFRNGFRDIMTSTSPDFVNWTEPVWLDYGEAPPEHLYTNAITPYFRAPHLHLGFPNRFMGGRQKFADAPGGAGVDDALLMSSRDMLHWERWREPLLYPTLDPQNWTDRNNYVAWGILPLNDREMGIYSTDHYRRDTARVLLNVFRTDGFASLYADMAGGQMLTRPVTFMGRALEVNYATSAAGSLRFELCDEAGKAHEGFALGDSEILFGNELAHVVTWKSGTDVSSLSGKTVRLRINLRDADLYALKFVE